jgi:3-mercaptopyruvate sulfurtransferase SseA
MKQRRLMVAVMIGLVLSWMLVTIAQTEEVPRMTKEELKGMLGKPEVIIIDVRAKADWAGSKLKIKGAVREDPRKVASWMDKYSKDKIIVFYCA